MTGLKNISKAEVLTLKDEVAYQKGQVVSKTLAQNAALSVTLFSFDKGEEISNRLVRTRQTVGCPHVLTEGREKNYRSSAFGQKV